MHEHNQSSRKMSPKQVTQHVDQCMAVLKASGNRVTEPRKAVIRCLVMATNALSPKEILAAVENDKTGPDIDQVTVYRILDTFSQLGLVHQVADGVYMACMHLDCRVELHALTRCQKCGAAEELDVPAEMISPLVWYLDHEVNFNHTSHFFQIEGICQRCSGSTKGKRRKSDAPQGAKAH